MLTQAKLRSFLIVASSIPIGIASACFGYFVVNRPVPSHPEVSYPASPKIDQRLELRLTEEFRNTVFEKRVITETWRTPLGEPLSVNSEQLARTLFSDVLVTRNAVNSPVAATVDAVLTPAVVSVEQLIGKTTFSDSVLTVVLEWTLKDQSGRLIWVETVTGEGTGNLWQDEKRGRELIDDLFTKSYQAIQSSVEIRGFVQNSRRIEGR